MTSSNVLPFKIMPEHGPAPQWIRPEPNTLDGSTILTTKPDGNTARIFATMSMSILNGKKIALAVTGSIAAIKSPLLVDELCNAGCEVTVTMTDHATRFVSRETITGRTAASAIVEIFPADYGPEHVSRTATGQGNATWHVHLGRTTDVMLIAPCSATTIGKLRAGIYDNPVTLLAASLPRDTPLIVAPAMDEEMWLQPALQESLTWLKDHGVAVIGPVSGPLASGLTGMGRMTEPTEIVQQVAELLASRTALAGKRILITGGPTYEPIDAVRFIGNRSSGKMAAALAETASAMGANVTLIMGPSSVTTTGRTTRLNIETAEEMHRAVLQELADADIIIMSAAVADFTPETVSDSKMKKREMDSNNGTITIRLKPTTDILAEIAKRKRPGQIIVGFALEKGDQAESCARGKLVEKNLDMIVLNNIAEEGAGFGYDTNKITIFTRDGEKSEYPLLTKRECAAKILEHILKLQTT